MLEFMRALRQHGDLTVRLPGLLLAFLIAEVFYKFHSVALECGAVLLTWWVLDVVIDKLVALLRGRAAAGRG